MIDLEQVETLKNKHKNLETVIEEEFNRPIPNTLMINDLKRQKLRIKDELASLDAL